MASLSTGQLAQAAGVNLQTVRYYERRGLLPEPSRTASGHRKYGPADVERLRFVRRAQALGFTLREIEDLLELTAGTAVTAAAVRSRVQAKVADLDSRITELQRIRTALTTLAGSCSVHDSLGNCPFLDALNSGGPDN
jgi:MerR family transcriptional regulator, copper efflux regulator